MGEPQVGECGRLSSTSQIIVTELNINVCSLLCALLLITSGLVGPLLCTFPFLISEVGVLSSAGGGGAPRTRPLSCLCLSTSW